MTSSLSYPMEQYQKDQLNIIPSHTINGLTGQTKAIIAPNTEFELVTFGESGKVQY